MTCVAGKGAGTDLRMCLGACGDRYGLLTIDSGRPLGLYMSLRKSDTRNERRVVAEVAAGELVVFEECLSWRVLRCFAATEFGCVSQIPPEN